MSGLMTDRSNSFLDRSENPLFGSFQSSPIADGKIVTVHTDEANNVTLTADVALYHRNGSVLERVPFASGYASVDGTAGIYAVPNVGDLCLVAFTAGNQPYIIGYHPAPQVSLGRATPATAGSVPLKGTFGKSQLIPGSIELKTVAKNRIMVHPGGSIAIDSKQDLFTFYDSVSSTIEHLSRQYKVFTAGGSVRWTEGRERSKRSMKYSAELFTRSATPENIEAGPTRGGARMRVLFSQEANYFFLEVIDQNDVSGRIQVGPNGVILTASDGSNQGSIVVNPSGKFNFFAGDPNGVHTELGLAPGAIAISAFTGPGAPVATVQATQSEVTISSKTRVVLDAPVVNTQGALTALGALGGLPVARVTDLVQVFGVQGGSGSATGLIMRGSSSVLAKS